MYYQWLVDQDFCNIGGLAWWCEEYLHREAYNEVFAEFEVDAVWSKEQPGKSLPDNVLGEASLRWLRWRLRASVWL